MNAEGVGPLEPFREAQTGQQIKGKNSGERKWQKGKQKADRQELYVKQSGLMYFGFIINKCVRYLPFLLGAKWRVKYVEHISEVVKSPISVTIK